MRSRIKNIISNITFSKFKNVFKAMFKVKSYLAQILFVGISMLAVALVAPSLHNQYIRSKVGSQVVKLTNKEGNSGGTGFVIKADNGKLYTITNAHVCNIPGNALYTRLRSGTVIKFKIIKKSVHTDLCALTAVDNMEGLKLASGVGIGETIGVVGHPKLQPLTLTLGELVGYQDIIAIVAEGPCNRDVGMYKTITSPFGYFCVEVVRGAGVTTVNVRGGSSGSPVVNFFGNVVGVLFAGDEYGWGSIVSLKDLRNFVKELK